MAAALDQMPQASPAQIADRVKPALTTLETALDQLKSADDQAAHRVLSAALAAGPVLPESGPASVVTTPGVAAGGVPDELVGLPAQPSVVTRPVDFGERLDQLSYRYLGDAAFWRLLADFNGIADPLHLGEGLVLRIPSIARGGAA